MALTMRHSDVIGDRDMVVVTIQFHNSASKPVATSGQVLGIG